MCSTSMRHEFKKQVGYSYNVYATSAPVYVAVRLLQVAGLGKKGIQEVMTNSQGPLKSHLGSYSANSQIMIKGFYM